MFSIPLLIILTYCFAVFFYRIAAPFKSDTVFKVVFSVVLVLCTWMIHTALFLVAQFNLGPQAAASPFIFIAIVAASIAAGFAYYKKTATKKPNWITYALLLIWIAHWLYAWYAFYHTSGYTDHLDRLDMRLEQLMQDDGVTWN